MKEVADSIFLNEKLFQISYACRPGLCKIHCCTQYAINVTGREISKITDVLDLAAKYKRSLRTGPGEYEEFYDEEGGEKMLASDEQGCPFLYRKDGHQWCALHSACLEHGLPLQTYKPRACLFWPLQVFRKKDRLEIDIFRDYHRHDCVWQGEDEPVLVQFLDVFHLLRRDKLFRRLEQFVQEYYEINQDK